MNIAIQIKEKRKSLELTHKDFADALGLGINGDNLLRKWEKGEATPADSILDRILNFAIPTSFDQSIETPSFTFIDLFAGIGGLRLPFQELGGKCVFTSEWDRFAQKTYRINYGETPMGDITKIEINTIPAFDILLAGFPCQPFSQAGLKKGFEDTRGTLFFEIERIISAKRPKAFLLENVKQLRGHDGGRTLSVIVEHLKALDYSVNYDVLKAANFGLPQNRERIYIVGFNKDHFCINDNYAFAYPRPVKKPTKLGDILEYEPNERYTISDRLYAGHLRRRKEHKERGNGFGFTIFTPESEYTNTISARYYKDGSEILIEQRGKNPRKLTPRECARLQGFPEDFIIPVSDTQAYKQFGNSVAVPVIRAIAIQMLKEMESFKLRSCD
ncbi:MAG TPA: DNA (cytosine-5-)-methyltransferase [Negativicutes bacterium]|nr:DNA (cytosine-5-)-methyltransferase [Clostridia bacterium]HWR31873.1 DNA (cytosine-5-)-methyltransferase [Negativicutes bacterium]